MRHDTSQKTHHIHNGITNKLVSIVLSIMIFSISLVSFVNYDVFADHFEYPPLPSLKVQNMKLLMQPTIDHNYGYQQSPSLKEHKNDYTSLLYLICEDGMQLVVRDNDKMACLTDDTVSKNPDWINKVIPQDDRLNNIKWCYGIQHGIQYDDYSEEEEMLEYTEEMNIKPNTIAFSSVTFNPGGYLQMCTFIPQFNTDPNIRDTVGDDRTDTVKAYVDIWTSDDLGGVYITMGEIGNNTGIFNLNFYANCDNGTSEGWQLHINCNNISWIAADIEYDDFQSDIEYDDFESGPIFAWTVPQP